MNLTKSDIPELKQFISSNYRDDYILMSDKFFSYFFKNYATDDYSFKILRLKENLVGMIGMIPYNYKIFNQIKKSHFLVNTMVDKSLRGYGIGPRLVMEAGQGASISYTTSYGKNAKPMYQKLKWNEMGNLNRFIKILDISKSSKLANVQIPGNRSVLEKPEFDSAFMFKPITKFDDSVDIFWKQVKDKYPITIDRTKEYLNWRYANHPIINYHIFVTMKSYKIKSFIILRIEEPPGYRIGRIIDFISDDDAEENTLFHLIEYCRKNDVNLIDFFFTGSFHIESLKKVGFREDNEEPYDSIPMLFNPVDRNRKTVNFAFNINDKKLFYMRIEDINNWYITKGDGDQDRPNILPEKE